MRGMIRSPNRPGDPAGRWPLLRWYVSSATFGVPQAAGPVAFALVALSMTGDTRGGAAMMLAMTLAQVAGAVPIVRLGAHLPPTAFLRLLIAIRTLALASIVPMIAYEASFAWLVVSAAVAGSVNGAAFGYLRAVLSRLAPASRLPRALGIAATLNELTFVLAPVAASGLGTVSPVFAVLALVAIGALPALLVPDTGAAQVDMARRAGGTALDRSILLWLMCAASSGAAVAAIEVGAVALALRFGHEPALAILFTVPLCVASVAGGIWTSVRNRMAGRRTVLAQLGVATSGAALGALDLSAAATVAGAVLIGSVLAPLGTHYSLVLDKLAPPHRRPEVFALLRTANATGVIIASATLTVVSASTALIVVTGMLTMATAAVAIATVRGGGGTD
ncbi:MAG: MFS transporter [Rhodospirillales bacterium]|nr:MAG: MFS transporter [Rhodospirillales bacterium]